MLKASASMTLVLPLVLTFALGCEEEKKPTAAPAPSTSAIATGGTLSSPPASAAASATAAATPDAGKSLAEKLKCDTLLPELARGKVGMSNYKLSQQTPCPDCGPTCSLVAPDKPFEGVSLAYTCNAPYDRAAADKTIAEMKSSLKKSVVGKDGKGTVMGEKDGGMFYTAVAFDDDSDCKITIDWMRGKKELVEPLMKMALANTKQADVDAAKKK